MEDRSLLGILAHYLKDHRKIIIVNGLFFFILNIVFYLYSFPLEMNIYVLVLLAIVVGFFSLQDFIVYYRKHIELIAIEKQIEIGLDKIPEASNLIEEDYQGILKALYTQGSELVSKIDIKHTEMVEYYTLWAHQIKTPISAMRLLLQGGNIENNKELLIQAFRIEEYVDMALNYLKIEGSSSDLVIQKHNLIDIVRQSVRKYATLFIRKNIALELKEMDFTVITDEKWLSFVIEQILSNSLKYTQSGKISIYMHPETKGVLVIEDTGIGIAEEDLPRVFEKGFTGYNGRMDKKATGIGLYLCKKILDKLSHKMTIESKINRGTIVQINISSKKTIIE